MNGKYPHFAIPEIYGESLSYYELLRKLVKAMNVMIDNYNTIPDQIAEAVANLDASQLFSAVLAQLIDSIATDNTKSTNAVKVYKKHDLLYATFNDTVNLYESLIDFTTGAETELIIGTNIREVNISELFIELRELIDNEAQAREQADQTLQTNINNEAQERRQGDQTLQTNINNEEQERRQADQTLQRTIDNGTIKLDQIWTNASPTSPFPSQTIRLDLSKYKYVVILSYENFSTEGRRSMLHTDVAVINTTTHLSTPNNDASANSIRWRPCTTSNTSITFGNDDVGGSDYCIPFKIWGLR